jgi:hypothetical protein
VEKVWSPVSTWSVNDIDITSMLDIYHKRTIALADTVEPGIWKHGVWKLSSIGNTILVKRLHVLSNMLTLLDTLELLALLWKLETVFQSIFVFPDSRFHCIKENLFGGRVLSLSNIFVVSHHQQQSSFYRCKVAAFRSVQNELKRKEGWESLPLVTRSWCVQLDDIINSNNNLHC